MKCKVSFMFESIVMFVCVDPSEAEQIVCLGGHLWQEE